jgi:crotonobetainyl-CoA:carnitine CoA-transferase CaiB-like acyl-CoA transferase
MQREAAMAHTVEEWMKLGDEHRIPIMRTNGLDEVLNDPHLKAVGFFETREHPTEGGWRTIKPPVKFSKTPASIRLAPPRPGQDNKSVLE